jgi:glutamate---cysteine ligase / carboxylate-amine ligase
MMTSTTHLDGDFDQGFDPSEGMIPAAAPLHFPRCEKPTLGVELEVSLVDPETGDLVPQSDQLLKEINDDLNFKPELFRSIIELNTGVCNNVDEVRADLTERIERLYGVCDKAGIACICTGTHPTGDWRKVPISASPRYQNLVDTMGWPARRLLICGVHVHVGMKSGEHAVALMNAMTGFLPHLLALSASSPYWMGEQSGLASSRVKIFESLPTAGLPPMVTNWREFVQLMRTLVAAESIKTIREIWWDIRPHPGFGTLEIRICDGINTLDEICAITALVQCLAHYLQELYDHGEPLPVLRNWTLRENKWRAARFGTDAVIIRNERGRQGSLSEHIHEWVSILEGPAQELGCAKDLQGITEILEKKPSYWRQLEFVKSTPSTKDLVLALAKEFRTNTRML